MVREMIDLEEGKYTVIKDRGKIKALRYGEEWRNEIFDNLIGAMFDQIVTCETVIGVQRVTIASLEKQVIELKEKLNTIYGKVVK